MSKIYSYLSISIDTVDTFKSLLASLFLFAVLILGGQAHAAQAITFYHNDILGSPVAVTDINGSLCWREDYKPYGEKILNNDEQQPGNPLCGLDDNQRGYTSHVHDKDIGLTYMQARYYDPAIGRFMGIDPVGFTVDQPEYFNRYAYAANNSYKYIDPTGKAFGDPNVGLEDNFPDDLDWGNSSDEGYDWGSYDCTACDDRNLMAPNPYQDDLNKTNQRYSYWSARLAVGDPFARAALDIVDDKGFIGISANRLAKYLGGEENLRDLGLDLMHAHHKALHNDIEGIKGKLSDDQFDAYHNEVFSKRGLSRLRYGGNYSPGWGYCDGC